MIEEFQPPPIFPEDKWIIEVDLEGKFHRITCSDEEYAYYLNNHYVVRNVIPFSRPPTEQDDKDHPWFQYREGE